MSVDALLLQEIGAAVQWAIHWVIKMGGVVYLDQIGLPVCRFWPKLAAERLGNALAARIIGH